jgi:hypothetical protein
MVYASPPNNNEDRKPVHIGDFHSFPPDDIIKMILNMMGLDTRLYTVRWGKGKT